MPSLAICSYFTKPYTYAIRAQARRMIPNILSLDETWKIHYIACTDKSPEAEAAFNYYKELFGDRITFHRILNDYDFEAEEEKPYQKEHSFIVAQMSEAVLLKAKFLNVDRAWLIESDVLPPPNCIGSMLDVLTFDGGTYDVAYTTYVSNGGGSFLGGFGTFQRPIPNHQTEPERRQITDDQRKDYLKLKGQIEYLKENRIAPEKELLDEYNNLKKELEKFPPNGIFHHWAKCGYIRGGWLDQAYPNAARGMILPVDWGGVGCVMMTRKALLLTSLDGFIGGGTCDIYYIYGRWVQNGINQALTTAGLCDHVVRRREGEKRVPLYIYFRAFFSDEERFKGHLRYHAMPWYSADFGVKYDPERDKQTFAPPAATTNSAQDKPIDIPDPLDNAKSENEADTNQEDLKEETNANEL